MNRRATLAAISASLMLAGLAAPAGDAAAQDAKSLVGTYTLGSADTTDASGKKTPTFDPNARGSLIFTSTRRYGSQPASGSLPQFASHHRATGALEENQANVEGSFAHFGKYPVEEKDKAFTFH